MVCWRCPTHLTERASSTSSQPTGSMLNTRWAGRRSHRDLTSSGSTSHGVSMVTTGSSIDGEEGGHGNPHTQCRPTIQDCFAERCDGDTMLYQQGTGLCVDVPYGANRPHKVPNWILRVPRPRVNADHNPVHSQKCDKEQGKDDMYTSMRL